jgi:hypothetical protein
MEVLQIMEDFPTERENIELSVRREAMAHAIARYLADEFGIEVWISDQTVFGEPNDQGQRIDQTTFFVRAFCTWDEMKEAADQALCECINHDSELVELGLLPPWKHGCIVPMKDYV